MSRIVIADEFDLQNEVRKNRIETFVVGVLARHYPTRDWFVDANIDGGTVDIRCSSISMKYGMVIHLDKSNLEMERRVYAAASELLERFRLSRKQSATGDEANLKRNIVGEVSGASTGEYTL